MTTTLFLQAFLWGWSHKSERYELDLSSEERLGFFKWDYTDSPHNFTQKERTKT